jgi:hypothetical protein
VVEPVIGAQSGVPPAIHVLVMGVMEVAAQVPSEFLSAGASSVNRWAAVGNNATISDR